MKLARVRVLIAAAVLSCCFAALAGEDAEKDIKGKVQEVGFGKFKLAEKSGTGWLFHLSKDGTMYKPDDWRPMVGDEVSVAHMEVLRKGNPISQATSVTLLKAGPNTPRIQSPVEVQIAEVGRSGYNAKISSSGLIVKFASHRGTKVVPAGWVPAPGEKAIMTFTVKSAGVFSVGSAGFGGIVYAVDKVEKAGAGSK